MQDDTWLTLGCPLVDPRMTRLDHAGFQRFNLTHDKALSNFTVLFNLRRYMKVVESPTPTETSPQNPTWNPSETPSRTSSQTASTPSQSTSGAEGEKGAEEGALGGLDEGEETARTESTR